MLRLAGTILKNPTINKKQLGYIKKLNDTLRVQQQCIYIDTMKKYINKRLSFHIKKRKEVISGMVLDYTNSWTLIRYNPVDFVIDGYMLINNSRIKGYRRSRNENFVEKVIKLKDVKEPIQSLSIHDVPAMLASIWGLLQIEMKASDVAYIVRLDEIQEDKLGGISIKTNGRQGKRMQFLLDDIWTIQFGNDYTVSLELLASSSVK